MLPRTAIVTALTSLIASATYADFKVWDPIPGSVVWSNAGNWSPVGVPDEFDTVSIDGLYTVLLDVDTASLSDITIRGGASVGTNGSTLTALSPSCGNSSVRGSGSTLTISPATGVAAALDHLDIEDGGLLSMAGGDAWFSVNLNVENGTVRGRGEISADAWIRSDGLIHAMGGDLVIAAPSLDLDGENEGGCINVAANASLIMDGPHADPLREIFMHLGSRISSTQSWETDRFFYVDAGGGEARVDGAEYTNSGQLDLETGRLRVATDGFINDDDGDVTLFPGTTLIVEGDFHNYGDFVSLVGVTSVSSSIRNSGTIHGNGLIDTGFLQNGGLISTGGGDLAFSLSGTPDLDGVFQDGQIEVNAGNLSLITQNPSVHNFNGSIEIGNGYTFSMMPSLGIELSDGSTLDMLGATLRGPSVDIESSNNIVRIHAGAPSEIHTTEGLVLDGNVTLNGDLIVHGPALLGAGAEMDGDGTLVFEDDVDAEDNTYVNVVTEIKGTFAPGDGVARYVEFGDDLILRDGSTTVVDLTANGHDLIESRTAALDGTLRVELAPGFQPEPGDAFTIINPLFRSGTFADLDLPPGFEVQYQPGAVRVVAVSTCPGDIVPDGVIDVDDLVLLLTNWGCGAGNPADIDGDGTVGTNDLITILANWGQCT